MKFDPPSPEFAAKMEGDVNVSAGVPVVQPEELAGLLAEAQEFGTVTLTLAFTKKLIYSFNELQGDVDEAHGELAACEWLMAKTSAQRKEKIESLRRIMGWLKTDAANEPSNG